MSKKDCELLIDEYMRWLRQQVEINEVGDACQISTPFVDRHNDAIEIFVERQNGKFTLTDDGHTVRDLRASGLEFNTPKRKTHLSAILNGFGVRLDDDEIANASVDDFPQQKHNLVQAILAVNDMFVMAEEHVLSLFKEDVALFLEANRIPAFSDFKLSGKSGFDHTFDFGLPRNILRPQRVVRAINSLSKDNATSFAFAVSDGRALRTDELGAVAVVNDAIRSPSEDSLAALRAYDIEPVLWSDRHERLPLLNGH
ncbi:MAG: DUF1828 domain-containing protein [Candidatus Rokubacteria bacterium]|nr:DUF1828 domain-containing protein [Candidatus Rokubacteria bacterium]